MFCTGRETPVLRSVACFLQERELEIARLKDTMRNGMGDLCAKVVTAVNASIQAEFNDFQRNLRV